VRLTLARDYADSVCTLGTLSLESGSRMPPFQTIEPPWMPVPAAPCGLKGRSCLPPGRYLLMRHDSELHPRTWALVAPELWVYHWDTSVPAGQRGRARTLSLIHIANYAGELRGCIGIGKLRATDGLGRRMVQRSADAMRDLQDLLPWTDDHEINIYAPD
jgi:uncharacterized protein DUF5675